MLMKNPKIKAQDRGRSLKQGSSSQQIYQKPSDQKKNKFIKSLPDSQVTFGDSSHQTYAFKERTVATC